MLKTSLTMSSDIITDDELVTRAEEIRRKIIRRSRAGYGRFTVRDADSMIKIRNVQITREGNFTFVTLNGAAPGFAKFNPADKKTWTETTRNGRLRTRTQTKYSKDAGFSLALHRAVIKHLEEEMLTRTHDIQERILD